MANSRLTFAQTLAYLDNIEKVYQLVQAVIDGGFTGEGTNTMLYALRQLVETRALAWTSPTGIRDVYPSIETLLRQLDTTDSAGTNRVLAPLFAPSLRAITAHQANYDTTYASFWAWFAANHTASPNDKVPGNVADLMVAAGINVDPDHCVPPAHRKLGTIIFSGASTAALAAINKIDPLRYKGHTVEVYCVARNITPDEIVLTVNNAKNSEDSPSDTGSTDFPITIASTLAATQVMDVVAVDGDDPYDLSDASLTITSGGKTSDSFILRVKEYRAAAV